MTKVTRYKLTAVAKYVAADGRGLVETTMEEDETGLYVLAADYDALLDSVDALLDSIHRTGETE